MSKNNIKVIHYHLRFITDLFLLTSTCNNYSNSNLSGMNIYHNGCSKTAEILYESLEDEIFNAIGADYCSNFYMLMFQIVFYRREKLMIMYF